MTTLTSIIAPSNVLTPSNAATVTNKTISGANNTISVCLTSDVSGALPVANGGFGQSSYTDGQLLIGNTAGNLTKTTLTAGCNIAITNSGGSITIAYDPPNVNSAWAWGCNSLGQSGDNTTVNKSSPVSVVGGFTDWCQVSTTRTALAIRTNGTAWGWGRGYCGLLGNNSTVSTSSPVSVVGGFTDWCQVSAGHIHSLGVRTNGTAWAWGYNQFGKLGDNTIVQKSSPVSVVGGFTDWCQIGAGQRFSLAVRQNGTAWAWGRGFQGALGDNTTADKSSPVSVVGGFTDWCQVAAGYKHSVGVRTNGTAWAWGDGGNGQLGDNTTGSASSPVSVVGGFTDWCQVSAGYFHALAVRTTGTAWAWGENLCGKLGDNTTVNKSSPVSVVGGFTNWCQVSGGYRHSAGVRQSGTAWGWGAGTVGQLGDNNSGYNRSSPVSVVGGFTDWCQISAAGKSSNFSTLAIRSTAT